MSYIDKDATLAAIASKAKEELADANHYFLEGVQLAVDVVEGMTEVQPDRKRGRWILQDDKDKKLFGWYFCSECGSVIGGHVNFCSECGADMRG